jgi:hypothetical protein
MAKGDGSMDEKIRTLIEQTPEKPPRSKLEPHEDLIRELRRKRCTYQDIAQFFAEYLNLKVAPSTIYAFVRARARRRRDRAEWRSAENTEGLSHSTIIANNANVRRGVEEFQRQPLSEEPEKPQFHYDENEPLRLIHNTTEVSKHR